MAKAPLRVAVAGTGWRAEFFLRACASLPERFKLVGIYYHSEAGKARVSGYNVPLVENLEALAALKPDYIVLALSGNASFDALAFFAARDIPVLCETFVADSVDEMNARYESLKSMRVQFAEQYQFQPLNAARLALAESGVLGKVYYLRLSIPTRHHPASLVRMFLKTGDRLPVIRAVSFSHKALKGPGRDGDPKKEETFDAAHEIVLYDYGDVQALNDFEAMQHRSFMRSNDFLVRGERGEIKNERVTYMLDALTPAEFELKREMTGAGVDLQGLFLRGVSGGQAGWLYKNEFMPARLYDDELAVASCMEGMRAYLETGKEFYGLKDELTDMYYARLTALALETGQPVQALPQSWMIRS